MKNNNVKKIVWAGLFMAMTVVATLVIRIPSPTGGYVNAGDALVILSAFILGPVWGAIAAGIGSALADIISGYIVYAIATLIIKALMAAAAGLIIKKSKAENRLVPALIGSSIAELIMIGGYFAFTATFLGFGWGAVAEIPGNLVQGVFGIAAGSALYLALIKIPYVKNNF